MDKQHKEINHSDERGYIQDILIDRPIEHVTFIFTKKNTVRGNHFHKETVQYVFVLEGKIEYHGVSPSHEHKVVILEKGDLIETPALEKHAIKALEDTKMIVLTRGPRGGQRYEDDTFRLEKPIVVASS